MLQFEQMPDESLCDFIKGGNDKAFETLVTRHHRRFYQMAYRWLLNREDAEDMVQQAFVKLWSGQARWKSGRKARFTTWFYTILYHQSIDLLRRRAGRFVELHEASAIAPDNPEHELAEAKAQQKLHMALSGLPDKQRIAVQLFYFEQLRQKDIAAIMGLNVKALESQLTRAKQNLRAALGDEIPEEMEHG